MHLEQVELSANSFELPLTDSNELDFRQVARFLADISGHENLMAAGLVGDAGGEIYVRTDVIALPVQDGAPVYAGPDGRKLRFLCCPRFDLECADDGRAGFREDEHEGIADLLDDPPGPGCR